MEIIGKLLTMFTFTCIPILLLVGFLTTDEYKNVPVFIAILFFAYIGITICLNLKKKK
jgi:ABC-type amino acid transport system permease subunit